MHQHVVEFQRLHLDVNERVGHALRVMAGTRQRPLHRPSVDPAVLVDEGLPACAAGALERLVGLLDGSRTLADVFATAIADGLDPIAVSTAFAHLSVCGALVEGDPAARSLDARDWEHHARQRATLAALAGAARNREGSAFEQAGGTIQVALRAATVVVLGEGSAHDRIAEDLRAAGIGRVAAPATSADATPRGLLEVEDGPVDLVISATPDAAESWHADVSRCAVAMRIPALFHHVNGTDVVVGPFVQPGESACFECFALRRRAANSESTGPAAVLDFPVGADSVVLDAVKFLGGVGTPATRGHVLRTDLWTGVPTIHSVLRLPRCPGCGRHRSAPLRRLWSVTP
jgi:hypothetical protein